MILTVFFFKACFHITDALILAMILRYGVKKGGK